MSEDRPVSLLAQLLAQDEIRQKEAVHPWERPTAGFAGVPAMAASDLDENGKIRGLGSTDGVGLWRPGVLSGHEFWKDQCRKALDLVKDLLGQNKKMNAVAKAAREEAETAYKRGRRAQQGKPWPPKPVGRPRKTEVRH